MESQPTRRSFLKTVATITGAVAAAATGAAPFLTRSDLLNQLAQHLIRSGAQIFRYSKF